LLQVSVLLLSAVLIFGPNCAAAVFNYAYNLHQMEIKGELLALAAGETLLQRGLPAGSRGLPSSGHIDRSQPQFAPACDWPSFPGLPRRSPTC
jgi:hypothetical protein